MEKILKAQERNSKALKAKVSTKIIDDNSLLRISEEEDNVKPQAVPTCNWNNAALVCQDLNKKVKNAEDLMP